MNTATILGPNGAHMFGGVKIFVDPYFPTTRREQFRFPRSKKSRMRKKWRKNPRNWREVDCRNDIYFIGGRRDTAFVHPLGMAAVLAISPGDIDQ